MYPSHILHTHSVRIYASILIPVSLQTTYENFRYRYDRKENPYNKGALMNLREIFLSNIPSSIKFRSFIEEEENIKVGPATPNPAEGIVSSKEIDIEMGTRVPEDTDIPLPDILRNFDYEYNNLENSFKHMDEEQRHDLHQFFPVKPEEKESTPNLTTGCIEQEQSLIIESRVRESLQAHLREVERDNLFSTLFVWMKQFKS